MASLTPTHKNNTGCISAVQRLQQELSKLMLSKDISISAFPESDNIFKWIGTIVGPRDTVYEGLKYKLSFVFPTRYPYLPPVVKFVTYCYHPNVDARGNICLDILKEEWSALLEVHTLLLSIQSLLGEPNIESPLNKEAAALWKNQEEYKRKLLSSYSENHTIF